MDIREKVYNHVKKIPKGKICTYGIIGKKLKIHPRAVARVLSKNPELVKTPCYRIILSTGKIGGYVLGTKEKVKLLKKEKIEIKNNKINLKKYLFKLK